MKRLLIILLILIGYFANAQQRPVHINLATGSGQIPQTLVANLSDSFALFRTLISSGGGTGNAFFAVTGPTTTTKTFTFPNASATVLTTNALVTSAQGGTGNGFTAFTGPASSTKTFTLPNASATILTDNALVTATQGGTANAFFAVSGPASTIKTYTFPNASSTVATIDATQVLTNKTINGSSNFLTNIPISALTITGTPDGTKFLRDDGSWQLVSSGNLTSGNKGSVTVTGALNDTWTINALAVTNAMLAGSIDVTTKITGIVPAANGGTGVNNSGKTITLANNFITSGNFALTLTQQGITNITLPTTGTLAILGANTFTGAQNFGGNTIENYSAKYNNQVGTTYTLIASDNGKIVTFNNAGAITLTVPAGLPIGFNVTIVQLGAGAVTISGVATTINNRGGNTKTNGQYAVAGLMSTILNVYVSGGDLTP